MAESAKERLLRYLSDAHAAEEGGLSALRDMAAESAGPDVRAAAQDHLTQTQSQADRLEARLVALGRAKSPGKSLVNTLLGKGSDLLNIFHDAADKQTQDVIKAYALENFEVGMYTSLQTYADAIGDTQTAQLAATLIGEEEAAGERFLRLVPQIALGALGETVAKERLLRYLNDAHAAVRGETAALQDVAAQSLDADVTAATNQHLEQAKSHLALLEQRITALGGKISGGKGALDTLIAKASNYANAFHDDQDKQTQDLIKLFALEKFGLATFTSLQAYAGAVGDADTGQLAQTLRDDESRAADQFRALIPRLALASVNRTRDVTVNVGG